MRDLVVDTPSVDCIDGFIAPGLLDRLNQLFRQGQWKFGWRSNVSGTSYPHWNHKIADAGFRSKVSCTHELLSKPEYGPVVELWNALSGAYLKGYELVRCYASAHTAGQDGSVHRDNDPDDAMKTVVAYVHAVWPVAWGGELQFYTPEFEVSRSFLPKPGRLVIFDGHQYHAAKSPARCCPELRICVVFKAMPIDRIAPDK